MAGAPRRPTPPVSEASSAAGRASSDGGLCSRGRIWHSSASSLPPPHVAALSARARAPAQPRPYLFAAAAASIIGKPVVAVVVLCSQRVPCRPRWRGLLSPSSENGRKTV